MSSELLWNSRFAFIFEVFWALKKEWSELHDWWEVKKRLILPAPGFLARAYAYNCMKFGNSTFTLHSCIRAHLCLAWGWHDGCFVCEEYFWIYYCPVKLFGCIRISSNHARCSLSSIFGGLLALPHSYDLTGCPLKCGWRPIIHAHSNLTEHAQ